jgi:hypothetical protein
MWVATLGSTVQWGIAQCAEQAVTTEIGVRLGLLYEISMLGCPMLRKPALNPSAAPPLRSIRR